ncbi:MAG TPA: hypothetical protein PK612_05190 [Bacilli bacterium]|nr:hypothetical protein [Bacilli bacterium]
MKTLEKIFDCVYLTVISFLVIYTFFFIVIALTFALTYLIGGIELDIEVCMLNWVVISTVAFLITSSALITSYIKSEKKEVEK